ncbi:hypothetical protein ACTFIV_006304 [Dictyostelium citrinum]
MSSLSDWENTKENIVPLKTGRDPTKLALFAKQTNQSDEELEKEKQKFETIINEYQGEDPIDNWLKYIKWVQQSYPGGNMKEQLIVLLERCTRLFLSTEKYKNDPRYLRIWITYADMCRDPIEVFSFLEVQRIGFYLSLLYEARAIVYENKGNYEQADKSFKQGIERKAQPIERLQQKHLDFERRLIARLKHQQQHQPQQQNDQLEQQQQQQLDENGNPKLTRSALGTISSSIVHSERKSQQTKGLLLGNSAMDKKRKVDQKNNSGFQIFDDEKGGSTNEVLTDSKFFGSSRRAAMMAGQTQQTPQMKWDELEPELNKHKENTQLSQKWSDVKVLQKKQKITTAGFQIYCDQDSSSNTNNENIPLSPDKLRVHSSKQQSKLEQIQNNPLANFPKVSSNSSSSSNKSTITNTTTKNERVGYNKSLFTKENEKHEISFEEYRASLFKKKLIEKQQNEKNEKEKEEIEKKLKKEQQVQIEREQKEKEQKEREQREKEFEIKLKQEKELQYQQHQQKQYQQKQQPYNPPSPTMTIHTKQAFNDVMAMFSEPLEFEKNKKSNSSSLNDIPSSPNPFTESTLMKSTITDNNKNNNNNNNNNKNNNTDISFDEKSIEDQENINPNQAGLLSSKITNRDVLMKQLFSKDEENQLDQERDMVKTIERIDLLVKGKDTPKFEIFDDSTLASSQFNSKSGVSLAEKVASKNKQSQNPLEQSQNPLKKSILGGNGGNNGGFTIFQDQTNEEKKQPLQQSQLQNPLKKSMLGSGNVGTGFTVFQDQAVEEKKPLNGGIGGFSIFQDEKQHTTNSILSTSLTVSTISPISTTKSMMDFGNDTIMKDENHEEQQQQEEDEQKQINNQNITGNITSTIDPTTVIICSLTPDDGMVNPYLIDHQYLLEQHVSATVQSIESFINVGDDLAPLPEQLDQCEVNQTFEDNSIIVQWPFSDITVNFTKCVSKSTMDGSMTFKVERIDDQAMTTSEDSWLSCKVQDPPSIWEFYIGNQIHQRLQERSLSVSKSKFPTIHSLYYYTDKSIMLMDHTIDQGTLDDVVSSTNGVPMEEPLAIYHCIELLKMIEDLHSVGIIHGNISTNNLHFLFGQTSDWPEWTPGESKGAWKSKGFTLTDFSRSIDTTIYSQDAKYQSPIELLPIGTPLEWLTIHQSSSTSSKTTGGWSYNLDYLGICKVIFHILTSGKEELKLSLSSTNEQNQQQQQQQQPKLEIINQSIIPKESFSEVDTLWLPFLTTLLNHNGDNGNNQQTTTNPLKQQRILFENYLQSNPVKSKIKSLLRIQNIKLFESLKSKQ